MTNLALLLWVALAAPAADGPKAFQSGSELFKQGKLREAIAAWEQAAAAGYRPAIASYNAACGYARLGDRDAAFRALDKVAKQNPRAAAQMANDPDLAALHDDPRWKPAVAAMDGAAFPCKHDRKNREFDFWLGDWDVRDPAGNKVGDSHVELMLGDCVLLESWTSASGSSGKSFNLWDAGRKQWRQTWVDDSGQMHIYIGDTRDGAMVFDGELYDQKGQKNVLRMTFTPLTGGKVRQLLESSTDGGKTWTTGFDGTYVRKGS
jgi:tetratricopeptide (TPR) repeat protein